jgi:ATP-binding cassette, subfamily B, bacterial
VLNTARDHPWREQKTWRRGVVDILGARRYFFHRTVDRSIQGFIGAVTQLLFNVFPALVYLVISVAVMLQLEWRLALLLLAFAPLPAISAAIATSEQTQRERTLLDRWARIYSRFNEVLSGIVTVRSFAMEDIEKERWSSKIVRH